MAIKTPLKHETTLESPLPDGYEINVFKWKNKKRLPLIVALSIAEEDKELKNDQILGRAIVVLDEKIESGKWKN